MDKVKPLPILGQKEQRRKEKRKLYRLKEKLKMEKMSDEERLQLKNKRYLARQAYLSKLSKEQLEERRIKAKIYRKGYWDKLSSEQRKRVGERVMARLRNLEGEKLEKQRNIWRRAVRRYHDKLRRDNEEGYREMIRGNVRKRWEWFKEYQRERVKRESGEERERRLLRYKVNGEKRKVRRVEGLWRGEEEMKRRLEEVEEEVSRKWEEEKEGIRERSKYKERVEARKPKRKKVEVTLEGMVEVTEEENLEGMVEEEIYAGNLEEVDQCLSVTTTAGHHGYHEGQHEHVLRLTPFLEIVGVVAGAEVDADGNTNQEVTWGGDLGQHANSLVEILPTFVEGEGGLNSTGIFMVVLAQPPTPPPLPPTPPPYFILEEIEEETIATPPSPPQTSPPSSPPLEQPNQLEELEEEIIPVKPFICEECGTPFSTARGVRDHKNKQHNPGGDILNCPECSKTFGGARALWRHFSKYHLGDAIGISEPNSLKMPPTQITCEYCHKTVIRGYQQHLQKMHPEYYMAPNKLANGRLQCPYCSTQLKSEVVLTKHLKYKHVDNADKPGNDKPSKIFSDLERKLKDKQLIKMDRREAWCLVCSPPRQLAPVSISIKAHFVSSHHETLKELQTENFVSCQFCKGQGTAFSNQVDLLKHLSANHPDQIFRCSECPVIKLTRKDIKIHQAYHRKLLRRKGDLNISKEPEKDSQAPKMPLFWRGGQQAKKSIKEKLNNLRVHCPECDEVMKCKALERHLKRKHNSEPEAVKDEAHGDISHGVDKLWCQICDKQLPSLLYQYAHSHLVHDVPLDQLLKLESGTKQNI